MQQVREARLATSPHTDVEQVAWGRPAAGRSRILGHSNKARFCPSPLEFDATVREALRQHGTRGLIDLIREEQGDAYEREFPPWAEAPQPS